MQSYESLENRIEELEHRARRPYLLLLLTGAVVWAVLMQYKIDMHFKRQIDSLNGIEAVEGGHHAE